MSSRLPLSHRVRPVLRLAGVLFVLAGLLGMHGLNSHGVAATETGAPALMATMDVSPASGHADLGNRAGVPAGPVDRAQRPAEAASASPQPGMDMSMAMMCVAILTIALIALLRSLLGARLGPLVGLVHRQSVALVHPGRDPDPPSLIALSIRRC